MHTKSPATWTWDTAVEFDQAQFDQEPAWKYDLEPRAPVFLVGETVQHPLFSSAIVLRAGRSLFGNIYRLATFNMATVAPGEPDYWIGDYDEQIIVACQGRG